VKLLSVDEARARMLAEIAPLPAENVPLQAAIGRVTAEDVTALRPQPPFTNSAMDGWALRSADAPGTLAIVGESAAGHGHEAPLAPGQAVRIFTGAALPAGADTVVIQEDAGREGDKVTVPAARPGDNVRDRGRDFAAGEVLIRKGVRLDPWRLSLAASAGRAEISVHRRPRVALVSTGEEIVEAPATPGPFQIYDAGSPALQAMAEAWGGSATRVSGVRDRLEAVIEALRGAEADLVVTVGGASVGDHDLVRAAGEALGLDLKVASVNVRPGKPTFFGTLADGRRMLGLPGNPASAFVCAELFLRPMLAAWQGAPAEPATVAARLAGPLAATGPREHWMRATLAVSPEGVLTATVFSDQESSLVGVFARADALVRRRAGAPACDAGEVVDVLRLQA
jgi:molybdopterin molybdotransferase